MLELSDGADQDNVTFPSPAVATRSAGTPGTAAPEPGVAVTADVRAPVPTELCAATVKL